MSDIKFPVYEIDGKRYQLKADLRIYAKEAVNATCYKFTDKFYVHQELTGDILVVTFESKDGSTISDETPKQFCNELIDQQIRFDTNKQFGNIRDMIVQEAFKPISK